MKRFSLILFLFSLFACQQTNAACTVGYTVLPTGGVEISGFTKTGDSFQATCSGNISSISIDTNASAAGVTLQIYNGQSVAGADLIATQTGINLGTGIQTITLATPVPVSSGNTYTFVLSNAMIDMLGYASNVYAGGQAYYDGFDSGSDFYFSVAISDPANSQPVPGLSTWGMMILSLMLLAVAGCKLRRH